MAQCFDARCELYKHAKGRGPAHATAHQIADYIYEKITGQKGIFATRIAFITKQSNVFRLTIADWDGENPSVALRSTEPIISPSWSPDGRRLAYVSFESQKPVVYVQDLYNRRRNIFAAHQNFSVFPRFGGRDRIDSFELEHRAALMPPDLFHLEHRAAAFRLQFGAQRLEILDDAVMDHRDLGAGMRVGIGFVGNAVSGPASVTNADVRGWHRVVCDFVDKVV